MKSTTLRAAYGALMGTALAVSAPATGQDLTPVTYLLPAPQFLVAFAPMNLADANGYFADEGIEIEFITVRGGAEVATQVGAGNALVGGGIGDTSIIVRPNGVPVRSVAVLGGGAAWDFVAAGRAGVPAYAIRTGGFSPEELRAAGAREVFDSLGDLHGALDRTHLSGR